MLQIGIFVQFGMRLLVFQVRIVKVPSASVFSLVVWGMPSLDVRFGHVGLHVWAHMLHMIPGQALYEEGVLPSYHVKRKRPYTT